MSSDHPNLRTCRFFFLISLFEYREQSSFWLPRHFPSMTLYYSIYFLSSFRLCFCHLYFLILGVNRPFKGTWLGLLLRYHSLDFA